MPIHYNVVKSRDTVLSGPTLRLDLQLLNRRVIVRSSVTRRNNTAECEEGGGARVGVSLSRDNNLMNYDKAKINVIVM